MALRRILSLAAVFAGLAAVGCVDRRFVIESNVPNAQVYIDNKSIGAAPAHTPFEYYGNYNFMLVEPGYETYSQCVHVAAPWYGYPPFDFFAEVLWPFHIRDTRRLYFELHEAQKTRVDDLLYNADALRLRGQNLPAPERPAVPKPKPTPSPQTLPPPQPLPPGNPVVPPVGPATSSPLVPGVQPGS